MNWTFRHCIFLRSIFIALMLLMTNYLFSQTRTVTGIEIGGDSRAAKNIARQGYPIVIKYISDGNENWDWIARDRKPEDGERDSFLNAIYMSFKDDKVAAVSYQYARYTFSPYGAAYNENNMLDYYESIYKKLCRTYGKPSEQDEYDFFWYFNDVVMSLTTEYEYDPAHSMTYYAARVDYFSRECFPGIGRRVDGSDYYASGSGFILNKDGYFVTNYHVIDGAQTIDVFVNNRSNIVKYSADVVISDKQNDISILKITDSSFSISTPPFSIAFSVKDVGTGVFALGYPMSNVLGEELKVTDGIISSKSGYQGDITTYQISAPIQPGNSGGPLFSKDGSLIGITNAGIPDAQNVGYAIKASYLRNLIESAPVRIHTPTNNTISNLSLPDKVKKLTPYVVLIKVK